jgi:2-aminoethylphosphonate-pyruvate transaminase
MPPPEKRLFTPGPLTTSRAVKEAMLRDLGSREEEFLSLVRSIRQHLLALAGVSQEQGYEAVLMQGSGTFGIESVLSTAIPRDGRLLVAVNGAYGNRMVQIANRIGLANDVVRTPENIPADPAAVRRRLLETPPVTHVAMVHCETTTGILNPVESIGRIVRESAKTFIVDAMSSFGGVPLNVAEAGIDYLVSSANKCLEGVPGFSFVLAGRDKLAACAGNARTVSLDLFEQWKGLETDGQFRFTPPTHAILALAEALRELEREGGITGRAARYRANHELLLSGMQQLGFRPFLDLERQSYIITAFHYPGDPRFQFDEFYRQLSRRGIVIYPGKLGSVDCFRIGTIGQLRQADIDDLLDAVTKVLEEMNVALPVAAPSAAPRSIDTART